MKTTVTKWATKAAGAGAIALLLATPSFAQSHGDRNGNKTDRGAPTSNERNGDNQANRRTNNQTFNTSRDPHGATAGRNDSFNREQSTYRGQADRGQQFRRTEPAYRDRDHDARSSVSINLGGIFRGGAISVGVGRVTAPYYGVTAYNNGVVRGVVERVDDRSGRLWLRDDASGQEIAADVNGYNLRNLRNGDYVQLTGHWINGGVFDVTQIDNLRG